MSTSCLETPFLADQRHGQTIGMMGVVEAEAALHAEAVLVRRAVTALDGDDLVVVDLVGQLAADAAIRADRIDFAVRRIGVGAFRVDEGRRHQRAGRAGLDALAAGDAGGIAHRVVEVEHDLLEMAAAGHADDVVDLNFTAGADAEIAVDAGVELHGHGRVREVVDLVGTLQFREAAVRDLDPVGPVPEAGVRIVRGLALGLVGDQELEHQLARGLRALGSGMDLHAGRRACGRRRRPARARPRSRPCRRGNCRPGDSRASGV